MEKSTKTEAEWKEILSFDQFKILRQKRTEDPFSGLYVKNQSKGSYRCAGCDNMLFQSEKKYDDDSGYPSFSDVSDPDTIHLHVNANHFTSRTEVNCAKCDGYLGYVFQDGPEPTGKRYSINSVSLRFYFNK